MANPEDMDTGKRDNLLRASDWTQLPDAPFSDAKKQNGQHIEKL